jgi:hypothetical protein
MRSVALTEPTDRDPQRRRQRTRSIAIAFALGVLVILFYAATIVRLGPNALNRDGTTPVKAPETDCRKAGTC